MFEIYLQDMENVITPTTMIWIHIDIQIYFRGAAFV